MIGWGGGRDGIRFHRAVVDPPMRRSVPSIDNCVYAGTICSSSNTVHHKMSLLVGIRRSLKKLFADCEITARSGVVAAVSGGKKTVSGSRGFFFQANLTELQLIVSSRRRRNKTLLYDRAHGQPAFPAPNRQINHHRAGRRADGQKTFVI